MGAMERWNPFPSIGEPFEAAERGLVYGPAFHQSYGNQAGYAYQRLVERILQTCVTAYGGAGRQKDGEGLRAVKMEKTVIGGLLQACYAGHGTGLVLVAVGLAAPWGSVGSEQVVLYAQDGIVVVQQAATREGFHPLSGVSTLARAAFAKKQVAAALQADA